MTTVTQRPSGLSVVDFDIWSPQHREGAVQRLSNMALQGSADEIAAGKYWYGEGHEITRGMGQSYGQSHESAAGATAVLSGGADWSASNVAMAHQALSLAPEHWKALASSHASEVVRVARGRASGELDEKARAGRTPEMDAMLREHGPALRSTTNLQLLKARRMMGGTGTPVEHPLDVLTRKDQPKYRAFYGGLIDPSMKSLERRSTGLPVDYRMRNIVMNQMWPRDWKDPRGAAGLVLDYGEEKPKTGRVGTPYGHMERIIADVGLETRRRGGRRFAGVGDPLRAQAYTWTLGKNYELRDPQAKIGPKRSRARPSTGQAYTTAGGSWAPYPD